MARLSNAQGLLFVEYFTEEVKTDGATLSTLKGFFGAQQTGQAKAIIMDTVNAHRGVVTHTVDDAILSSFADARAALHAALEIQQRFAAARTPNAMTLARARAGLAYGPVRVMAGKVTGEALTAAALLMENCPADEILVDQSFLDAVRPAENLSFEPRPRLGDVTCYAVRGAGMPPPAPKTVQTVRVETAPSTPPPAQKGRSVILKYGDAEKRFDPGVGVVIIGRGLENHIIVPVKHVSRKHAKIIWVEDRPVAVNLSPNGCSLRPRGSNKETPFTDQMPLEGAGDLALCASFSQVSSQEEIVGFRLAEE